MDKSYKIFYGLLFSFVLGAFGVLIGVGYRHSKVDVGATMKKNDCHRSGEFAGRNSEPIYQCGNDPRNKYTYSEIYHWAWEEVK